MPNRVDPTSEDPVLCFKKDVYCHIVRLSTVSFDFYSSANFLRGFNLTAHQRPNPPLSQGLEEGVTDSATTLMFFRELTYNVVYSLYPCDLDDAVQMAAVHLHMAVGSAAKLEDVECV